MPCDKKWREEGCKVRWSVFLACSCYSFTNSVDKKGKKRKADEDEGGEDETGKKKNKPATKITKGRLKGPIDLDRQCGVINDKGLPCSRALTCKSHAMGAKRAVLGRSKDYDILLNEFNKERNPNYVEPVKRQSKAERKEKEKEKKAEKKRQAGEAAAAAAALKSTTGGAQKKGKKASGATSGQGAATVAPHVDESEDENLDDVDSEAELESMVKAVRNAQAIGLVAVPLAVPYDAGTWFGARRERLRNCRDQLASAFTPRTNPMAQSIPTRMPA